LVRRDPRRRNSIRRPNRNRSLAFQDRLQNCRYCRRSIDDYFADADYFAFAFDVGDFDVADVCDVDVDRAFLPWH
jgi:hypothetical protein